MSTTAATPKGVEIGELASFCGSLDEVEQAANGYGSLQLARIEADLSGTTVIATFADNYWHLTFKATK